MRSEAVCTRNIAAAPRRRLSSLRELADRRRTLLAVLTFAGVAALLTYRAIHDLNIPDVRDIHRHLWLGDFRDAIYYAVVAFRDGNNPYDTAAYLRTYPVSNSFPMYSPATLLVYLPFGLMPFEMSEGMYFLLSLALTLVLAWMSLRESGKAPTAAGICMVATAVLVSRPGYWNQLLGQCTIQIVIGTYLALRYGRDRPWLAAIGLALSALKPTYGVALTLLMLARGELRAVLMGAALSAALAVGPLLAVVQAAGGWSEFLEIIPRNYHTLQAEVIVDPVSSVIRIDAIGLLGHLSGMVPSFAAQLAITSGILGMGMFAARRLSRRDVPGAREVGVLVSSLTILTFTYHQNYDLLLLTLPITSLAVGTSPLWQRHPALRKTLLALLLIPAANHLLAGRVIHAVSNHHPLWLAITSINGAALTLALLLSVAIAMRLAPLRARAADDDRSGAVAPRLAGSSAAWRAARKEG